MSAWYNYLYCLVYQKSSWVLQMHGIDHVRLLILEHCMDLLFNLFHWLHDRNLCYLILARNVEIHTTHDYIYILHIYVFTSYLCLCSMYHLILYYMEAFPQTHLWLVLVMDINIKYSSHASQRDRWNIGSFKFIAMLYLLKQWCSWSWPYWWRQLDSCDNLQTLPMTRPGKSQPCPYPRQSALKKVIVSVVGLWY